MANTYFQFKQFIIHQDKCAMKVTTDACLFGGFVASLLNKYTDSKILDIGTGTGLLTLMLAQKNQNALIDSIEIDKPAFEQASVNCNDSPWHTNINLIYGNVNEIFFSHKYDIIICNPPFYENELKGEDDQKSIAHHSEKFSLSALLSVIKKNLSASGRFYLLFPYKRFDEIKELLESANLFLHQLVFIKQSVTHSYFRFIVEGSLENKENDNTNTFELAIKDEKEQYSPEFITLLKDYYLHL